MARSVAEMATPVEEYSFVRAIVACDFCVAVTLKMLLLYVFVAMELGARRALHLNVTDHPSAAWTTQHLRVEVERRRATD